MSLSTTQYGYIVDPMVPFTDDKGKTIKNGFIRVFMAGTSTPVLTYRNYDGATNQEKIELDNSGRVKHNVIGSKGSLYKVVVYNILHSQENPLLTVDKIAVLGASINATGATIVTGLDSVTVQEENFIKATVEGTGVELALDPTEVTSEVSTTAAAVTAAPDYVVPLLDKTGEGDSKKISLANLFKFALDWISRLATTITSFASGDFIAVSNPTDGTRKMSKDTLLQLTSQNALGSIKSLATTKYKGFMALDDADGTGKFDIENLFKSIAPIFDPTRTSETSYGLDDLVIYNGRMWRCVVSSHYGDWNNSHFVLADVDQIAKRIKDIFYVKNFDASASYAKGAVVRSGSVYIKALEAISPGAYNPNQWKVVTSDILTFVKQTISSANYDLNNCPSNSIVVCANTTYGSTAQHKPSGTGNNFVVITLSHASNASLQLYIGIGNYFLYERFNWGGTWHDWLCCVDSNPIKEFSTLSNYGIGRIVRIGDIYIKALEAITAGAYDPSKWKQVTDLFQFFTADNIKSNNYDLDNCPTNSIIYCTNHSYGGTTQNRPDATITNFLVFTISADSQVMLQFFMPSDSKTIYARRKWATWGEWSKLMDFSDIDENVSSNVLSAFSNIVCIGDSLTWSQVYTADNSQRQAYRTYPQVLGKLCGADSVEAFALPGDTAITNWERYKDDVEAKTNGLAIIYLGTNAGLTDTLSTDAPENTDPSTWADTNTGDYAKWVSKLQGLGYKVLLIKPWAGGGGTPELLATTKAVISQIGTRFGCAVLDSFVNTDYKYHYYPDLSGRNSVHYNDLGYAWFASMLIKKASQLGTDQMKYIIPE